MDLHMYPCPEKQKKTNNQKKGELISIRFYARNSPMINTYVNNRARSLSKFETFQFELIIMAVP